MSNRHVHAYSELLPDHRNSGLVEPMGFPIASRTLVFVPFAGRVVVAGVGTNNHRANNNANRWRARA